MSSRAVLTLTFLTGAATGAAAEYFLDPQGGASRRRETRDKTLSTVKTNVSSAASQATAKATAVAGQAQSAAKSHMPGGGAGGDVDDVTLARKVETEIFRAADAPKGQVSVNAENGVVFLRGEIADTSWIERLGSEAEQVAGVKAVRNLLHTPGTPAPTAPAAS